jgi:hypothetical protein
MKPLCAFIRILLLPLKALVAVLAVLFVVMAAVAAIAAIFTGAAAAVVAYIKREEWTLPAFRWARDRTGRWSVTPWSSSTSEAAAPQHTETAGM